MGAPVEVSWGLFAQDAIEARLRTFLDERGRRVGTSYRDRGTPSAEMSTGIALDPEMTDGEYLIAAATFAEIQAANGNVNGSENAHRIWEKLFSLYPETRKAEPSFPAFDAATTALFFDATTRYPRLVAR